ncbi:MAG: ribulose-phosphate 3-epimerase [Gammaproteobacteria bacterium]|nr:ribulose-phosphate 3-epimerase [Gammaproteobacteria bacterium]
MKQPYQIAASILSADFARLGAEVEAVMKAGADMIHFDVMDNHFVPNLTIGPAVCQSLRRAYPDVILDVHLMINPVNEMITVFAEAGASIIAFHPEASENIAETIGLIRDHGCQVGMVINPDSDFACLTDVVDQLDAITVMSVYPGFGGQKFIPTTLDKIAAIRSLIGTRPIALEVDGGIKADNIADVARAGADRFVAGSAIFHSSDYRRTIADLREAMQG